MLRPASQLCRPHGPWTFVQARSYSVFGNSGRTGRMIGRGQLCMRKVLDARRILENGRTWTMCSQAIHSSAVVRHKDVTRPEPGTGIKLHWKDAKGDLIQTTEVNEGDDLLSIAHEYDIDLEGACEGSVACSTCHVILPDEYYDKLPEPEDEENDMLDMAFGLTDTSRLGCQVTVTKDLDGMTITLPSATRNMFVDGKKPTHH